MTKRRLVITGSEGLIGRYLVQQLQAEFEIIKLDLALGHNLADSHFVSDWFAQNKDLYGLIVCHAHNPVPVAGTVKVEPIDTPLTEIRDYLEVNVVSAFDVCREFIRNNKRGVIINISSLYGSLSPRHDIYTNFVKPIGYSLSKGAIVIMSKYLAAYYAPDFRVSTVILGGIRDPKQDPQFVERYSQQTPMGRLMNIEEVLPVFKFLLDPQATYVTGSEIVVDGGWMAW